METNRFTEALESRMLMSANPLAAAVQADQLQVHEELLQFQADIVATSATLTADVAAIKAADVKAAKTLTPLIARFHADVSAMCLQLKADCLAEQENALVDNSVILGDQVKIAADRGNSKKETADHAKLVGDEVKLQTDMVNGLNTRLATRNADCARIFADGDAIVAAAQLDPNATPALVAALGKWNTDKQNRLETFEDDLGDLIADRSQLIVDLNALLASL